MINFAMMQHHNYSLTELENMMPFEREIYVTLLEQHIKEENERIKREQAKREALLNDPAAMAARAEETGETIEYKKNENKQLKVNVMKIIFNKKGN